MTELKRLPCGPVVKNLSNAGDVDSIFGHATKISHAMGQLSPQATTTEPVHHNETLSLSNKTQ